MKILVVTFLGLFLTGTLGRTSDLDKRFLGQWSLNVARSDFGPWPKPKMGIVNWTEHGWAFALVTADDQLITDAVITDHGCSLIGDPPDYTCEFAVVSPRHATLTMRQRDAVRVVSDFELVDNNTTKVTHRRTPAQGPPFTELGIWERVK